MALPSFSSDLGKSVGPSELPFPHLWCHRCLVVCSWLSQPQLSHLGLVRELRNIVQVQWFTAPSWREFPWKPTWRWRLVCGRFTGALSGSAPVAKGRRQDWADGDAGLPCSLHNASADHKGQPAVQMTFKVIPS